MRKGLMSAAAGLLLASTGSASAASLIVNGGFEDVPAFSATDSANRYKPLPGGTLIPGWRVTGEGVDAVTENAPNWFVRTGTYAIDLDGSSADEDTRGGLAQIVTGLQIGTQYRLVFWADANAGTATPPDQKLARVSLRSTTGTFLVADDISVVTNQVEDWVQFVYTFTADATSATLRFRSLMTGGQSGLLLDDVALTVVPLPFALPMFLAGLGALGLIRRRRTV